MSDVVFDTTVVAWANRDMGARRPGNSFDRRLRLLERARDGQLRIRYNKRLLGEYQRRVMERRNDIIEMFFVLLDSTRAIRVSRNNLSRQHHQRAVQEGWPSHDQHLLAAAVGGDRPCVYVDEHHLAACGAGIHRVLGIRVQRV